jgi:3-methyl-2-oxobutanoate hydroxymethyltransferase
MSKYLNGERQRVTIPSLMQKKKSGEKIVMLTAYDYQLGRLIEASETDIILVGDSLANVVLGYKDTLPLTIEDMLYHTRAVTHAVKSVPVIVDMPFLSYQVSIEEAVRNAGRCLKEAKATGVKLEGAGKFRLQTIERMIEAGIPVMGHIGLTPQSINVLGTYSTQGKTASQALILIKNAKMLEEAGVFSMVLENISAEVAEEITSRVNVPTIGIGSGAKCDGQVLVTYDLLGYTGGSHPWFVRKYADLDSIIENALKAFCDDVKKGNFPSATEERRLPEAELNELMNALAADGGKHDQKA